MRQRRASYDYPEDFAGALIRFKEASGLSWGAMARELGTSRLNLWRWRNGVRPNTDHLLALQDLARRLSLDHLLPTATLHESA